MLARGFNRVLLGRKIDKDKATIGRWLSGKSPPKNEKDYDKLEQALTVTGIRLPHAQFLVHNGLNPTYPFMKSIPLYESNEFSESGKFEQCINKSLETVRQSVHYTHLCDTPERQHDHYIPRELCHPPFVERLRKKEVEFQRVGVFFKIPQFIAAVRSLIEFRGTRYECRFYLRPPASFPVINLRSFDHRTFMIGGYEPRAVYRDNCILLEGKEPMGSFLSQYWDAVWSLGNPVQLNFETAEIVAKSLSMKGSEQWQKLKEEIEAASAS